MAARQSPPSRLLAGLRWFLAVPLRGQTWKNLAYLALTFPLGVAYFTVLVTGFSLVAGLLVVLVGVPLFVVVLAVARNLAVGERLLAQRLLGADIPSGTDPPDDLAERVRHLLTDRTTWTGLVYLATKFPIGLGAFVGLTTLGAFTVAFLSTPLIYRDTRTGFFVSDPVALSPSLLYRRDALELAVTIPLRLSTWQITTLPEALAMTGVGVLTGLVTLHLSNAAARLLGWYARGMLRGDDLELWPRLDRARERVERLLS